MTALLERQGQWGAGAPGGPAAEGAYDNSYLIADAREAWVLETTGRRWVARRSRRPRGRSPTRRRSAPDGTARAATCRTMRSRRLVAGRGCAPARLRRGVHGSAGAAAGLPHPAAALAPVAAGRGERGEADVAAAMAVLRDHYEGTFLGGPYFNAARPDFLTLCMHAHPSGFTWGNTASSAVSSAVRRPPAVPLVGGGDAMHSVYVPVFVEALPETLGGPGPRGPPASTRSTRRRTRRPTAPTGGRSSVSWTPSRRRARQRVRRAPAAGTHRLRPAGDGVARRTGARAW